MSLVPEIEAHSFVADALSDPPESGVTFKDSVGSVVSSNLEPDQDFLQRQYELARLDQATKVNWEKIKKLTVCGVAFLNDAYDMFAINIVAMILGF
ncbi:hypothetical protein LPJ78_004751, partial [Coemansia sp. RSA 989]